MYVYIYIYMYRFKHLADYGELIWSTVNPSINSRRLLRDAAALRFAGQLCQKPAKPEGPWDVAPLGVWGCCPCDVGQICRCRVEFGASAPRRLSRCRGAYPRAIAGLSLPRSVYYCIFKYLYYI